MQTEHFTSTDAGVSTTPDVHVIDADVHPVPRPGELAQRLPEPWRSDFEQIGPRHVAPGLLYPRVRNGGQRLDAYPDNGPAGSDLGLLRQQLLDGHGVDIAILIPLQSNTFGAESGDLAAALARAVNEWIREDWLDQEPRLRTSINIPLESPDLAAQEIERYAGDSRFVQVLLPTGADAPLGDRKYWPIYAAASEAGIPVAAHTGGRDHHRGAGWPSFYLEEHVWYANAMQSLVTSMICEGVFDRFPALQVVCVEGGLSWAGPLSWALDTTWTALGNRSPRLERRPSEYLHENFWMTTQPMEEPSDPKHILWALHHTGMTDRILFASDYPHWDADVPWAALPRSLPKGLRSKIMAANAGRLYGIQVGEPDG